MTIFTENLFLHLNTFVMDQGHYSVSLEETMVTVKQYFVVYNVTNNNTYKKVTTKVSSHCRYITNQLFNNSGYSIYE